MENHIADARNNVYFRYRKYVYFRMSSATPGVVMVKTCSEGEETSFCLLKNECFYGVPFGSKL
ncbi:hypothetical protein DPMN_061082, partial [Dreissena polymorpha]